ncbi:MAG TPA: RNA polymerase sigma factor [Paracoccaceae bacterium]|nr:RNA polymerase sigma factor [Paracoccaceae bacterium]
MSIWPVITELLPELRAYGRSISASRADAEDLVSDAIERAARSGTAPRSKSALRPWLFRTMRNLTIDGFRKARLRREYLAAEDRLVGKAASAVPDPAERLALRAALDRLRREERQLVILVDIAGLTYAEAAAAMEIPIGTVMSRLSRARRALVRELDGPSDPRGRGAIR